MEKVLDKLFLLTITTLVAATMPYSVSMVVAALTALSASALFDVDSLPGGLRVSVVFAYLAGCLLIPNLVIFLPLISYDCFRIDQLPSSSSIELDGFLRLLWIIPLLIGLRFFNPAKIAALLLLGILANLRAWQSSQLVATLAEYRLRRDELSAQFSVLQEKNYDLAERQLMDLRLATLTERSRVAREIHDNVGHLLTRLILQTQAMQLVYGRNAQLLDSSAGQPTTEQPGRQLAEQLTEIGQTLRQAYDSVRQSVHGLQEEAFELSLQLQALAHESENSSLRIRLNYDVQTESPPRFISYSVLAIVREALVNIQKHSDATAVNIALTEFPAFYQLTIQDNGTTKPASADLSRNGIGLTNMEDRVVSLGGVFSAGWDNGFRIFASLPKESAGKSGG